jgi:uncharacterized protein
VTSRIAPSALTWNVASLLGEPPGATRDYLVAGVVIDLGEDLHQSDPLEGHVRLARTNRGLLVTADLTTSLDMECSRCLRDIEVPIAVRIEEEALPGVDLQTGLPVDTSAEPDALRLTDHHELELEPTVRETIQLAEPIAPLCEANCPGLCPVCGERMTDGQHAHVDEEVDPRFEALRAFTFDTDEPGSGEPDEPTTDDAAQARGVAGRPKRP